MLSPSASNPHTQHKTSSENPQQAGTTTNQQVDMIKQRQDPTSAYQLSAFSNHTPSEFSVRVFLPSFPSEFSVRAVRPCFPSRFFARFFRPSFPSEFPSELSVRVFRSSDKHFIKAKPNHFIQGSMETALKRWIDTHTRTSSTQMTCLNVLWRVCTARCMQIIFF